MSFDLRTLLVIEVMIYLVVGLLQLGMWRLRGTERAFLYWGFGNVIVSVGCLLGSLRSLVSDLLSIVIGNALIALSIALVWAGQRRFAAQAVHWWLVALAPLVIVVLFAGYDPVGQNIMMRTAVLYGVMFLFCALGAFDLWRAQRREWLGMRSVALVTLLLLCMVLVLSLWFLSQDQQRPTDLMQTDPRRFLSLLSIFVAVLVWDMTLVLMANERLERRLVQMARMDPLTQVFNRAGFRALAEESLQRSIRRRQPVSLLLMDLDHFKRINDSRGHEAGDVLLRRFAASTQAVIRAEDLLARHGGEEFCLLLPGLLLREAAEVAERIRAGFERQRVRHADRVFGTTVSIGVVQMDLPGESLHAALARADAALYQAKHLGRNRVAAADAPRATPSVLKVIPISGGRPDGV